MGRRRGCRTVPRTELLKVEMTVRRREHRTVRRTEFESGSLVSPSRRPFCACSDRCGSAPLALDRRPGLEPSRGGGIPQAGGGLGMNEASWVDVELCFPRHVVESGWVAAAVTL